MLGLGSIPRVAVEVSNEANRAAHDSLVIATSAIVRSLQVA